MMELINLGAEGMLFEGVTIDDPETLATKLTAYLKKEIQRISRTKWWVSRDSNPGPSA